MSFARFASAFGLTAADEGATVTVSGKFYKLVDISPRRPKRPLIIQDAAGKRYACTVEPVLKSLGRAAITAPKAKKPTINPATLSPTLLNQFDRLACRLSPENLSCDGEIRGRALAARRAEINREWKSLEKQAGGKVDLGEIESHMVARLSRRN